MSLAEIKSAVDELSEAELTELASFIRKREEAAWDRQIGLIYGRAGLRNFRDRQNASALLEVL